jgi:Acetyltransferase (isoleucine patch superfamily)
MKMKALACVNLFCYKLKRLYAIIKTKFILWENGVCYGHYKIVGTPIVQVTGKGKISFGNNLQMNNGLLNNQIGYNTPCIFRAENGSIFIGDNVGLSQATLIAKNVDISIGDNVKLGGGVKIYTTDFHSLNYEERRTPEIDMSHRKCAGVVIGDDCFIGAGTIILKGVTIGERTIIGAGSVVVKDIPSDVIAAGNPCKVIKSVNDKNVIL